MTPEQATFLLNEIYLPQIASEAKTTRRVIEAVPADKGAYKPDERSMAAWELAKHIASSEIFFLNGVASGQFNRADGAVAESVKTPAELGAWYEENINKATARLKGVSGADLTKNIDFMGVFNLPAANFLALASNHAIHHRGQLSAYLRPMGAKVPRIYGGSADEPVEIPGQSQKASN